MQLTLFEKEEEIKSLKQLKTKLDSEITQNNSKCSDLEKQIENLTIENQVSKGQIDEMSASVKELIQSKNTLDNQLNEQKTKNQVYVQEVTAKTKFIESLKSQIEAEKQEHELAL